jgi:hypothetical protein
MAGSTRLELATSGVTGRRSNQLNYDPAKRLVPWRLRLHRDDCHFVASAITRFPTEPRNECEGWLANRSSRSERKLVGGKGFEPLTAGV